MRAPLLLVAALAAALTGCSGSSPKELQPTIHVQTFEAAPHACTYISDSEAETAVGTGLRKTESKTDSAITYCTYRGNADTMLVVAGGAGGEAAFAQAIANAEADFGASRRTVPDVPVAYVISGSEHDHPVVLVGALRGQRWFTAALRSTTFGRSDLEAHAGAVLAKAIPRLERS